MGLFSRKTAEKLDDTAEALYKAGRKVGGEAGGRVGDAIATTILGGLRSRCDVPCTRTGCDHD